MSEIFVFGSNLAGRHGKGAALHARHEYGAKIGVGEGRTGNAYAIPTKDRYFKTLPLWQIKESVDRFLKYARRHRELIFILTPIGCGLAGYKPSQIGPMFKNTPANVRIPKEFKSFIDD